MVTDGDHTYRGEHFKMYVIIESPHCIPETNITWNVNYTSVKKEKARV